MHKHTPLFAMTGRGFLLLFQQDVPNPTAIFVQIDGCIIIKAEV